MLLNSVELKKDNIIDIPPKINKIIAFALALLILFSGCENKNQQTDEAQFIPVTDGYSPDESKNISAEARISIVLNTFMYIDAKGLDLECEPTLKEVVDILTFGAKKYKLGGYYFYRGIIVICIL